MEPGHQECHDGGTIHPLRRTHRRNALYTIRFTTFENPAHIEASKENIAESRERTKTRSCFITCRTSAASLPVKMRCATGGQLSRCYLAGRSLVPTHSSELAARIALYMLCADLTRRAEIYATARMTRQQAAIRNSTSPQEIVSNRRSSGAHQDHRLAKRMVYMPTHSILRRCPAQGGQQEYGYNIHACIFDELLGQSNRKLYETMTQGSGAARKQPLNFIITT